MASRLSNDAIAILSDHDKYSGTSSGFGSSKGSNRFAILVCIFASLGGLFFGYDQGVTGGVLVMDSFREDFCIGYKNLTRKECEEDAANLPEQWLDFTSLFNVTYYIGCIFGAFGAGFICDKFGRRWTVFLASSLFCAGTIWVISTPKMQHNFCLVGRVIEGMGVGMSSFALPVFNAEMAPKELRGMLSGMMQMTVVTGLLLAGIVNYGVKDHSSGWRLTNGVALAAPVIVMIGIFFVPESPRWLYASKGREAAQQSLQRLRETSNIDDELNAIGDVLVAENGKFSDVFSPKIRKRLFIAVMLQLLQQATGINPMFTYGGIIFEQIIGDGFIALLILQIVNFLSTIPALYWVDRYGRRSLLLIGAVGMVVGHVVSGISFSIGCDGDADDTGCSTAPSVIIMIFTAFFIFNFAISWGPVCWIYPAEIFPLHVRAKAVSLSTMTNWTMGALMIVIPKLFPYLNIDGVFYLFTALCASAGIFVYFMCPETKNVLLEDIEAIFNGTLTSEEAASNSRIHKPSSTSNGKDFKKLNSPKTCV